MTPLDPTIQLINPLIWTLTSHRKGYWTEAWIIPKMCYLYTWKKEDKTLMKAWYRSITLKVKLSGKRPKGAEMMTMCMIDVSCGYSVVLEGRGITLWARK
jgi:hypothetical protein